MAALVGLGGVGYSSADTSATHPKVITVGSRFSLELGESAIVKGRGVKVTFAAVTDDSRCRPGQVCFWEGDATVHLRLTKRHRTIPITLHTSTQFNTTADALGLRVRLIALNTRGDVLTARVDDI
ncbi:MAG TPA: hypothetical protein VFV67_22605 [Actinophytocola sp.]|uniref:hypothetical protein n=1 Tax=Actinophytocola sp. TaxID=1872138 RepID=UPI002DB91BFC|nr:hypothetical protein [Actinophytocola sp.]HEU5473445.1 hypothetical protein [Actinophytocola sp.]